MHRPAFKGRGLVLLIAEDPSAHPRVVVQVGDHLELATTCGEVFSTRVTGVEFLHWESPRADIAPFGILVSLSAAEGERLCGAKIWITNPKEKNERAPES